MGGTLELRLCDKGTGSGRLVGMHRKRGTRHKERGTKNTPMRIAFDETTLTPNRTGIGYYSEHLLSHLAAEFTEDEWVVISNQPLALSDPLPLHRRLDAEGKIPWRIPWIQLTAPRLLQQVDPDVAHFTNSICPLRSPVPTVLTIHDMSLELFPHLHPRRRRLTRWLVRRCARRAQAVIAVSESGRRNICAILGVSSRQVVVVREAAALAFRPIDDRETLQQVRSRYHLPERFLLHVGTIEPRKNLVNLVQAFSRVRDSGHLDLSLVLVGKWGWGIQQVQETIETLGLRSLVRLPGYIEFGDLPALYSLAVATIYPSLHEGFGLPVVEAMACGSPVITSANSSLIEVAGDAALMLDGPNPSAIATALRRLLNSRDLREELAGRSLQNVRRFSWSRAAAETHQVYEDVARSGS